MLAEVGGFRAWLESLDDEQLLSFRFELYDRCEVSPEDSGTYAFARAALELVYALERRRALHRELAAVCTAVLLVRTGTRSPRRCRSSIVLRASSGRMTRSKCSGARSRSLVAVAAHRNLMMDQPKAMSYEHEFGQAGPRS
jgi:hypothetical protein